MTKTYTLRLNATQQQQLEIIRTSMGEATTSKVLHKLINERMQLRLSIDASTEQIDDLKRQLDRRNSVIHRFASGLTDLLSFAE